MREPEVGVFLYRPLAEIFRHVVRVALGEDGIAVDVARRRRERGSGCARGVRDERLEEDGRDVVLTVAWDISWYQYRIAPEAGQPVRLAERGHDPGELESLFTGWNARLTQDGRIAPDISPV